jgi:hypothetical protein
MAILGNNVKGTVQNGGVANLKVSSPFVLASAQTMTELHGWFTSGSSSDHIILHIYTDTAGSPDALVAYTSPLALTGSDVELSQSGFSVPLAAGTYWIGWSFEHSAGSYFREGAGGSYKGLNPAAAFSPPSNPYGTTNFNSAVRLLSVWAVVGVAAAAFVPRVVIT